MAHVLNSEGRCPKEPALMWASTYKLLLKLVGLNQERKMIILFAYDSMICKNIGIIIWIFLTRTEEKNCLLNKIKSIWNSGFSQTFTPCVFYVLLCCHLYVFSISLYLMIKDDLWKITFITLGSNATLKYALTLEPFDRF